MAPLSRVYPDPSSANRADALRSRFGGSRGRGPSRYESLPLFGTAESRGSHMPIDTQIHWELRNPLNFIPAIVLVVTLIGVVAALF